MAYSAEIVEGGYKKFDKHRRARMGKGEVVGQSIRTWPEYFDMIESGPKIFFGECSIKYMQFEVQGILYAEELHNIPQEKRLAGFSFELFEAWVYDKYNPDKLPLKSYDLAYKRHNNDSSHAFGQWFDWYHEFINK